MKLFAWIFGLLVFLPAVILGATYTLAKAPSLPSIGWQLSALAAAAIVVFALSQINSVRTDAAGRSVVRTFGLYTFKVPREKLAQPTAVVRSSSELGESTLGIRTNGVSIPGYHSGWFRTTSNRKAFVAIVDSSDPIAVFKNANGADVDLIVSEKLLGAQK